MHHIIVRILSARFSSACGSSIYTTMGPKRLRSHSPATSNTDAASKVRRSDRDRRPSARVLEGGGLPISSKSKNREPSPAKSDDEASVRDSSAKYKTTCLTEEEEDAIQSGSEVIEIQSDDDRGSNTDATSSDKSRPSSPAASAELEGSEDELGMLMSMHWVCHRG